MSKWILAAGAAAIAFAAPALADQDGNKGKGGGNGGGKAQVDRGGGGGNKQQVRVERGGGGKEARGQLRVAQTESRGKGGDKFRARSNDRVMSRDDGDRNGRRLVRFDSDKRGFRGLADNCVGAPPGLVGKNEFCMPPGQYKKYGSVLPAAYASRTLDGHLSQWYRDNDRFYYRNDDNFIYRVNRNGGLIDALFPFADRDYSYYPIGMNYPSDFNYYNVPNQYQSFYPDGGNYNYRYGDGAIYQLNPSTNAIQSIVALLAGDLGMGQRMPQNYGAYNVPLQYRDRYYDTPDAMYRYNDGYIYRADPSTQLITAVIDAIV